MADYKELLRRAIKALPENNGASRRAVYEKARSALVAQLRAINPPLPAKDITQHRLQLEDCIRQVEHESSEAVIAGLKHQEEIEPPARPAPAPQPPAQAATPEPAPQPVEFHEAPVATAAPQGGVAPANGSIEDIIAAAEAASRAPKTPPAPAPVEEPPAQQIEVASVAEQPSEGPTKVDLKSRTSGKTEKSEGAGPARPIPAIVARAAAIKSGTSAPVGGDSGRRGPVFEPRRDSRDGGAVRAQAVARQQAQPVESAGFAPAMSAVREVELEASPAPLEAQPVDPQHAIDMAIATLDREARGEAAPALNGVVIELPKALTAERAVEEAEPKRGKAKRARREEAPVDASFTGAAAEAERGGSAVAIFLVLFLALVVGAGGAGFWAWREGYIDFNAMFDRGATQTEQASITPVDLTEVPPVTSGDVVAAAGAPENPIAVAQPAEAQPEIKIDERLEPTPEVAATPATDPATQPMAIAEAPAAEPVTPAAEAAAQVVEPTLPAGEAPKTEERLPVATAEVPAVPGADPAAALDPTAIPGSQSLLLEASDDGTTGAVPFSGTVEWSKGVDELNQPTLIGKAKIPARNLGVDVLIRKNSDPSLPASHLMEINFSVSDSFVGGSVAGLPGVLLKNEELVQGSPLVGASARVVGNSFLFALSASAADSAANNDLLTSRKWMDLAIIYATGKRAIITLEKDQAAEALFAEVFGAWGSPVAASGQ